MGFIKIMSDDIQEKDMENILSSIKDILEEDERKQHMVEFSAGETSDDILGDVLNSTDTIDILDLSPDMVVDSQNVQENDGPVVEISEAYEASSDNVDGGNPVFVAEDNVIIEFDEKEPYFEKNNSNDDALSIDVISANIDNSIAQEVSTDNFEEIIPDVFDDNASGDVVSLDELLVDDNNLPVEEIAVSEAIVEETPMIEETAVYDPVIEIEPVVEETIELAPVAEEEQSQDVSANIMSSFAKMFSHEEQYEKSTITSVGNSSKTLEEFVVDAVQKAIGNEITTKWNNGADFNGFVEAEIRRQVELWIVNNMNGLIEDIVKKEVERVMVKVSS